MSTHVYLRISAWYWDAGGGLLSLPDNGTSLKSISLKNDINKAESTEVNISFRLFLTRCMAGSV